MRAESIGSGILADLAPEAGQRGAGGLPRAARAVGLLGACVVGFAGLGRYAGAEELRDPFVFGPRRETVEPSEASVVLVGILWDAHRPVAVIGEELVGIGQEVAGWRMVEIRPDHVVIERGSRRETLALGEPLPPE